MGAVWYTDNGCSVHREGAKHLPHVVAEALGIPYLATHATVTSALQALRRDAPEELFDRSSKIHDAVKPCVEPWVLCPTHAQFIELRERHRPILDECALQQDRLVDLELDVEVARETVKQLRHKLEKAEQDRATVEDQVVAHKRKLQHFYDGSGIARHRLESAGRIVGLEACLAGIEKQMSKISLGAIRAEMATAQEEFNKLYGQELKHMDPTGEPMSPQARVRSRLESATVAGNLQLVAASEEF